jgi:hypothetical protein
MSTTYVRERMNWFLASSIPLLLKDKKEIILQYKHPALYYVSKTFDDKERCVTISNNYLFEDKLWIANHITRSGFQFFGRKTYSASLTVMA